MLHNLMASRDTERDVHALDRLIHLVSSRFTRGISPAALSLAYADWLLHLAMYPGKQLDLAEDAATRVARLAMYSARCMMGGGDELCVEPAPEGEETPLGFVTRYQYDPVAAKRLLAEATADGAFDPLRTYRLYVPSTPRPYLPQPERVARFLQASLDQAGIRTELVMLPYPQFRAAVQAGEHDMCVFGWVGDTGDPVDVLRRSVKARERLEKTFVLF